MADDGFSVAIPSGVFSWITLNYLLGRLSPEYQHPVGGSQPQATGEGESGGNAERPAPQRAVSTVGCIDMGGASLQVAFEVPPDVSDAVGNGDFGIIFEDDLSLACI